MANPVRNIGKLPFNGNRVDSVTILNTGNMTLQLASVTSVNPLISVSPSSGSIPPLGSAKFQVTAFGLEYGTIQGDLIITHNATTTPDTQKVEAGVYSGTVQTGWNLVSVPLDAPNYAKTAIFPSSVSSASRYSNGYVTSTTLDNGIGYWLKFPAAESTVIDGAIRIRDTAFVAEGWNMIGTPTLPVPLDSISSSPPGIVASAYFRYTNSYQPASQLLPVQGYWVKADGAGMIIMRSRLTEMPPAAGHTGVEPGPAHGTGTIGITDAEGRRAELYTLAPGTPNTAFELPPAPPAGLFDARYHDGSYASAAAAGSGAPIEISSAAFPATVNWSFDDPSVVLLLNGSPAAGGPAGSVTLESSSDRIAVAQGGPRAVPHSFAVSHYPNPFNPAARIRYELPAKAHVRVVVFDALGREVEELYSGEREAGSWEVEFDASGRPSGVYLYRVIAGGEATGEKLLLVR
jgi:hypothetical protein